MESSFISRTSEKERRLLREAGFVHITGLTEYKNTWWGFRQKRVIGRDLKVSDLGRSQIQHHISLIVTLGGEIWLSASFVQHEAKQRELFSKLMPNQPRIEPLPCTDGWNIPTAEILRRMNDPDCEPGHERVMEPRIKAEPLKILENGESR